MQDEPKGHAARGASGGHTLRTRAVGWTRLALAVLVAAPLAMGIATAFTQASTPFLQGRVDSTLSAFGVGAMLGLVYGAPSTAVIGLPAHAALVFFRRTRLAYYAALGLASCFLNLVIVAFSMRIGAAQFFAVLPTALIAGPLAGAIFWLIRRPDQIGR